MCVNGECEENLCTKAAIMCALSSMLPFARGAV